MVYNYKGSVAERNVKFSSSVEVIVDEKNELFNAFSIYVPASLAANNIVDFDPDWVSVERPAVFSCVLDNYKEIMKGKLLDQWQDIFRGDTNPSVILYLIVFKDDEASLWEMDDVSIKYKPLTDAFGALFHISYVKVLFDETYDGRAVLQVDSTSGEKASATIRFQNVSAEDITIPAGQYRMSANVYGVEWTITLEQPLVLPAGYNTDPVNADGSHDVIATARTPGIVQWDLYNDGLIQCSGSEFLEDSDTPTPGFASMMSDGINMTATRLNQGSEPTEAYEVPSRFFDLSLALAYQCKLNLKLSYFVNMVKISYVDRKPNPEDRCWIRLKTSAEHKENMLSVKDGDREKYYWGALYLMGCTQNTWTLVHSEPVNIIPLVFAAWFAERNDSGQYVGNKLSLMRLRGTRIKPLGFPSWLNSEVNENDDKGFDQLDEMNVGYLYTISDNTVQESCLSSALSIDGTPMTALMISKWVDYTSSQQVARMLTDTGTLTKPVLTNEQAYKRIQSILFNNLSLFVPTKRIFNVQLKFPPFSVAKVGIRELVATSSWKASYSDDLSDVTVTGGITVA